MRNFLIYLNKFRIMAKENRISQVLLDYSSSIQNVIDQHELEDVSENLIMDYITELHNKGIDLSSRDPEKEVFTFYAYYEKYKNYLILNGENSFVLLCTSLEVGKIDDYIPPDDSIELDDSE